MTSNESHSIAVENLSDTFHTHLQTGLTQQQARERLEQQGPNELVERPRPGFLKMLLDQFNNSLVIILIVAAVISLILGEIVDASAIMAIVVLNAILGVVQESKAEQALAALKKMAAPNASVLRDGHRVTIPARELVPGDIVYLESGNYVPADIRLIKTINLKVEEASLTGESVPVNKDARVVLDRDIPLGDRKNSAFMGTVISYGRGAGLVTSTGMLTQIGLIAEMLQSYEEEDTPLQQKLDELGKLLGIISLVICGIIFLYGILRDTNPMLIFDQGFRSYLQIHNHHIIELFMTAVSLAIAAVPEGLAAVVTICLALGMQRMVRRHSLIRKLPAVETLGCATVICSDKTGTLTQNEMTVVQGWAGGASFQVSGEGYSQVGEFSSSDGSTLDLRHDGAVPLLLHGATLCSDARLEQSGEENGQTIYRMVGDPTEGALVVAAAKAGINQQAAESQYPRVMEIPFDSSRKRMVTIHNLQNHLPGLTNGTGHIAFIKGAPEVLLGYCDRIANGNRVVDLTKQLREQTLAANKGMARQALRVIGVAYRPIDSLPDPENLESIEENLVFVGMLGMIDPARPEVKTAVEVAHRAGLKSVMVTGDYPDTAAAIASEIGLLSPGGRVVTGTELEAMDETQLADIVEDVDAFARVSPQHKVKIVEAFKARGHVVAMTGDGVNDAPAVKRANIGIAMGIAGTDVTKETADMVLTDDNYASIVSAIEEGRVIYSNIRKFVFYLISCNIGEILVIFLAMLAGLPIPLTPIQLLWLNLVTDGAPALALGLEKGDPDIMNHPPRPPKEPVINRNMQIGILVQAIVMTAAVLVAFVYGLNRFPDNLVAAQTVAFSTLVVSELLRAFTARSEFYALSKIGIFSNRWMLWAVLSSLLLLLAVVYVPFLQSFFGTVALSLQDWLVISPLMLLASIAAEITKAVLRRRNIAPAAAAAVGD
ncbi:calcium-translocating P-type ATPase, SERCA-type [Chloroflexota bacterium]